VQTRHYRNDQWATRHTDARSWSAQTRLVGDENHGDVPVRRVQSAADLAELARLRVPEQGAAAQLRGLACGVRRQLPERRTISREGRPHSGPGAGSITI
jgi:hypothetical protein